MLAGVLLGAWTWRHPNAFHPQGGYSQSHDDWPAEQAVYFDMASALPSAHGEVTFRSVQAIDVSNSAKADIEFFVCKVDSASSGGVGAVGEDMIDEICASLTPAAGATMQLHADPRQQLVAAITTHAPGEVSIQGARVTYSHG